MNLMVKRTLLMLVAVAAVVGGVAMWKHHTVAQEQQKNAAMKIPPQTVATAKAAATVWQRQIHAVGSLSAVQGVTVSAPLEGTVAKISFESGQHVKAGDLLVQLDVSTDEAQLRGLEAQSELSKLTLDRARQLRESNTNSQAEVDTADAQYKQALAAADNERAVIAKKTVRAAFDGRLGLRQVNLGQYLAAGGGIAALQSLDPIYVDFTVPEQEVANLKVGQAVKLKVDAQPGVEFTGQINALNSRVDEATRNIQVQATLRNSDEKLIPGMFASVDVVLPHEDKFVTLPQTAIVYNPYGNAVFVVERTKDAAGAETLVARQHFVELGETRGDQVAILKGIGADDEVVIAGQIKLRNGSAVKVDNSVVPGNNPAPTPPNS